MLRRALLILGVLCWLGSGLFVLIRVYSAALNLFVAGGLLLAGILLERWRYAGTRGTGAGTWQATGERFLDPTSGKLVEVYFNPVTGERDYRTKDDQG